MKKRDELKRRIPSWLRQGFLGSGRPLDITTRTQMEHLLSLRLSDVRVHDTQQAAWLAQHLGARAFAYGTHIFADRQKVRSEFVEGRALLAHELTHVGQSQRPGQPVAHRMNATPLRFPTAEVQAPNQIRTASINGEASEAHEAEARSSEQRAGSREADENATRRARASADPELVADRVYALMREDFYLSKERTPFR